MTYFVYVLRSNRTGETYTGQIGNLAKRLEWHNAGLQRSTKHAIPWEIVHSEDFNTRSEAMKREKFLKSGKGREIVKQIVGAWPSLV